LPTLERSAKRCWRPERSATSPSWPI
jgi:hypothetical protein